MHENAEWELVPITATQVRKLVDSKIIFSLKYNDVGEIDKFKARLFAKGYTQIPGTDHGITYAPTPHDATLRLLLTIANHRNLDWLTGQRNRGAGQPGQARTIRPWLGSHR